MEKRKQGQQPKWKKFTEALGKVVNQEHPVGFAIICTDEELVDCVNELLDDEDKISYRTLRRYKDGEHIENDDVYRVFVSLYKRALVDQKKRLFEKLEAGEAGYWQKYAWIIERKFSDWNLRQVSVDETPRPKKLVFRVSED